MKLPSLSLEINRQRKQTLRLIEPVPFWEGGREPLGESLSLGEPVPWRACPLESLSLGRACPLEGPVPWKGLQCAFRDWLPGFVQAGAG
jgi:hypothetical protein